MKFGLILFSALALTLFAQTTANAIQPEFVSLDGTPRSSGNPIEPNPDVRLILHFKAPVLWVFRTTATAPLGTVLLCPGGAYCALEMKNEGENTARELNKLGFDVAILEYHIASGAQERDLALADAVRAFHLLKSSGEILGLHNRQVKLWATPPEATSQRARHMHSATMHNLTA